MNRSLRILSHGWQGDSTSVFTFGYFVGIIVVTTPTKRICIVAFEDRLFVANLEERSCAALGNNRLTRIGADKVERVMVVKEVNRLSAVKASKRRQLALPDNRMDEVGESGRSCEVE